MSSTHFINEILAVAQFIALALTVICVGRFGRPPLYVLSASFILISNITVGIPVVVFGVELSLAIIVYSMVYFIADLMSEYYGKYSAYRMAACNLLVQILLYAYVSSSLGFTPTAAGAANYGTMHALFGTSAQITVAALVAAIGPFIDVRVFWYFKRRYTVDVALPFWRRVGILVVRNKLSTLVGQLVNTIIFFTIAFAGVGITLESLGSIIVSAFVVKTAVAVFDVPFFILFERFLAPKLGRSSQIVSAAVA